MENLCHVGVIKQLLKRHQFQFSKSLGQHFLINPHVCPQIAMQGIQHPEMGVLEIGPGIGVLTNELCKRAKKVVAIELDQRLFPILHETLKEYQNLTIVSGDVMKLDLKQLISSEFSGMNVAVCANLPYYITSPILMRLLEESLPLSTITVMVQKETGVRLCAEMGTRNCGAITFAVRYYSHPQRLFSVSKNSFMPAPQVDSAVIQFQIKPAPTLPPIHTTQPEPVNPLFLFSLVKAGFSQRRKSLANPIASHLHIPKEMVQMALQQADLTLKVRAEQLSFSQWIVFSNQLYTLFPGVPL